MPITGNLSLLDYCLPITVLLLLRFFQLVSYFATAYVPLGRTHRRIQGPARKLAGHPQRHPQRHPVHLTDLASGHHNGRLHSI